MIIYVQFELKNIENALRRWKNQVTRVQDEVNIENLLENDLVRQLNEQNCYWSKIEDVIKQAFQQEDSANPQLRLIENAIEDRFFETEIITIEHILQHSEPNQKPYGYDFIISYKGYEFQLFIPIKRNITIDNLKYAAYGEFVVSVTSGRTEELKHSYNEDDICSAIQHYVEEHMEE